MYGKWWATFLLRACSGDFMISNSKVSNDNKKRIFAFFIVKFGSQLRCNGALRSAEKRNVALESINTPAGHKIFSKSPMTCNLPLIFRCPLLSTSVHFASPTPYFRGGGFFFRIGRNKTISHWDQSISDSKFLFRKLEIHSARQKSGSNVSRILGFANLIPRVKALTIHKYILYCLEGVFYWISKYLAKF